MTVLTDWEWVIKAASTDEDRPVLTAVEVTEGGRRLAATDAHRLHVATVPTPVLADGLVTTALRPVEGRFPDWQRVIGDTGSATYEPGPFDVILGLLEAATVVQRRVGMVHPLCLASLDTPTGPVFLQPQYVLDALSGMEDQEARIVVRGPEKPIDIIGSTRRAVIMPVRQTEQGMRRFDLTEFMVPVVAEASVEVPA